MGQTASMSETYVVRPVGYVRSALTKPADAPMQGTEGAPDAWLEFEPPVGEALSDLAAGSEVIVITWLHLASRDVLRVHPRDDESRPMEGVFSTRSQDRPNPIGLHPVSVIEIDGLRVKVSNLEAVDGTPILDIKPVLRADCSSR
jgi:tRNA-Thr(GGU) m(6)t(6)A37 methyltransferase TsaA